ncbi:MAG: hypothetical protein KAI07_08575, partial [Deltaproteobacteria bacterium]|nr:hypothetical protein [Deltaproteobacteria bacterium]
MKKLILLVPIVLFALSSFSFAADEDDVQAFFGSQGGTGLFCNIEGAEVCVVARTEDDCTKLGGEKVDSCPASQNQ